MPLEFAPGERFAYSNSGYVLLGQIIEKVAGKTYETFLRESIFEPLGMADSGYDSPETLLKNRAAGYQGGGERLTNAAYLDMTIPHAAGALYSTVLDLHRWSQAIDSGKLISKESLAEMFTPVKDNYGYGWFIDKQFDRLHIYHGGGINGFSTAFARYPEEKLCVAVLCNVMPSAAGTVARDLAAIALGEPYELPVNRKFVAVDEKTLESYAGQYELASGVFLVVRREGNRLYGQPTDQPQVELQAESDTKFSLKAAGAEITFVKDAEGQVTHLLLRQGRRNVEAKRIK
jgi:CubicO group peptidase (beta-lactamase class C family)